MLPDFDCLSRVDCRHTSFGARMTSMLMERTFALSQIMTGVAKSWRTIMTLPSYAMNRASFPEMYERWLVGPLFRPWAEMTLEELALSPGDRVLDIACGTGIAARVARERLGHAAYVVGIDISPDMLAVARTVEPAIDWREGNASALPLCDGEQFDVVVCQQGLQFFPDKPAAAAQMRGALAKVAGWRWPRGAQTMKSRSFESCAASRSATWAPSSISGTA
ncbi:class I SAM-dependent methyltransferase [Rhizobium lentis]|uniref:SAM-dependent methyltransferase n=1 Tax=Rhizobium lentis TaxID=1138194 RepID=A0A7W8XH85_9HYPH|nr:methyltransferase domain-containing protein [Rhizobium lentis]MBB4575714.1 SAM-dependent methyltransferase [Rhizobium lentis]MBB5552223.1 SAM-dependent methyltransferase [Rhizobium lentis]MBB5562761.1 SAM-dependent methyltransferase [Rhizobium lentis]MBB5569692.1 SAM-dependent methyltransferase [Rhizobium lentis]